VYLQAIEDYGKGQLGPDGSTIFELWRDQEALRSLAVLMKKLNLTEIYLSSSLEGVSGGSIGFCIEAIWFGYPDAYAYTGSSSVETGWLPSYPLSQAAKAKVSLERIAVKTIASEIEFFTNLGLDNPLFYDPSKMPTKLVCESSVFFLEQMRTIE